MANEDVIGAKKQMQMYCIEDPSFEGSREQLLIESMVSFIQDKNRDEYMQCVS